jgi:hypothetical protein
MIKISAPSKEWSDDTVRVVFPVALDKDKRNLWYEVDAEYHDFISETLDAAAVALLIPAMIDGDRVILEGKISSRLFYNLQHSAQSIFRILVAKAGSVQFDAEETYVSHQKPNGVATGFSAGVDSFSVLQDNFFYTPPPGYQLTHLLFNNVGSHGRHTPLALFHERFLRIRELTAEIGLPCIKINSNLDEFFPDWMTFQQSHTPRNVSVGLLLQNGIGRWLYASTYQHSQQCVAPTYDTAYADMLTLPLLSTDTCDTFSAGGEYSRVEKTLRIATNPFAQRYLDVCAIEGEGNCSHCWKCLRTLLTLEIAGQLERFADVFDLDLYARRRGAYVSKVLRSRDPLLQEIVTFARERGFRFPLEARLLPPFAFFPREAAWKLHRRWSKSLPATR